MRLIEIGIVLTPIVFRQFDDVFPRHGKEIVPMGQKLAEGRQPATTPRHTRKLAPRMPVLMLF
jgi:hypothetical protein